MAVWKIALLVASSAMPAIAYGQDFPVMDWGSMIQAEAVGSAIREAGREGAALQLAKTRAADRRQAGPIGSTLSQGLARQAAGAAAPAVNVSAGYTATPAVRRKLAGIMGDAAARQGKAQGDEMRQLVLSGKAVAEYQRIAPALGLRSNDAADAYAFYLLAQWGVANDYRADFTRAQAAGVRRQAANAYAGIADQLATDALRQEFGEMLIVQGMILSGVHEGAVRTGDDAAARRHAALARRGGQAVFTMDPTTISLTDNGFRRK
jgi:hypothetical protein